jgi:50S ribosomal protein L16 3-hydroxylase
MPTTPQNFPVERIPLEIGANERHRLGMPPARFLRDYWQKRPLLIRNAFPDFTPPLSPDDLAGLACMDGALARIVLRDDEKAKSLGYSPHPAARPSGRLRRSAPASLPPHCGLHRNGDKWEVRNGPFDDATFAKLPKSHWTLLVQDVDKWDADTAALLTPFDFIPSWRIDDVMISYAVDGGGVGAHVDQYDVFLLQGSGQRRWSIDMHPNPSTAFREDVELKLLREFNPTHAWTLNPGDMLYLPPGVPHDGIAVGECMTFSIGMRAPATGELLFDFAAHVAESLPESQRFADPDLKPAGNAGEIDAAALRRARRAVGPAADALDDDAFADWFGAFITRYRAAQVAVPRKRGIDRAALAERLPHVVLERDPWSRFAWRRRGRDARLYAAGSAFDAPTAWARVLASGAREFGGLHLAGLPRQAAGIALLASLIDTGHLRLRKS